VPDVNAVADLMKTRLGYEVRVVRNATKADMIESLNKLVEDIDEKDSVTIYYAGHGYQMGRTREGYWIPVDGTATSPDNWLSNNDINKYLSNIAAKQVMLISDSCYSGTLANELKVRVNGELQPSEVLKHRSVMVMSSGGEEPVADLGKGGHSIFAWSLMQAMKRVEGWKDGSAMCISKSMRKSLNLSRKHRDSTPLIAGKPTPTSAVMGMGILLRRDFVSPPPLVGYKLMKTK